MRCMKRTLDDQQYVFRQVMEWEMVKPEQLSSYPLGIPKKSGHSLLLMCTALRKYSSGELNPEYCFQAGQCESPPFCSTKGQEVEIWWYLLRTCCHQYLGYAALFTKDHILPYPMSYVILQDLMYTSKTGSSLDFYPSSTRQHDNKNT